MSFDEVINYIESAKYDATRLGLERTFELCSLLGNPQDELRFVHVTGSNGKGSVCAFLSSILSEAGYKTGLYTSPQIEKFNDKIKISGIDASDEMIEEAGERVIDAAKRMSDHPSQFEMITALAFLVFKEAGCDIVVLEVGMGGETDSTNVIKNTEVAVINNICLEHTEYLGNTIEAIAKIKSGIVKPGCDVVVFNSSDEVIDVVTKKALEVDVKVHIVDKNEIKQAKQFDIPLMGSFQINNLEVALEVIKALRNRKYIISNDAIKKGVENTKWPARFEVLKKDPLFILDGGHNLQCALAVKKTLDEKYQDTKFVLLLGVLKDKDYLEEIRLLKDNCTRAICITPNNGRALSAFELAEICVENGLEAIACDTIGAGVELALSKNEPILAFGSLYSAGEIRNLVLGD